VHPLLTLAVVFALLWGAAWGSFLNVVVWRLPRGESVVRPRSRCPSCGTPIAAWHNVPVLSWMLLGGRCAQCKTSISWRYPVVEATAAALSLAVALPWLPALVDGTLAPWHGLGCIAADQLFAFALLAIALIDADTFLVPDVLSLPLVLIGLGIAFPLGELRGVPWQLAGSGALAAGLGLFALQWGYAKLTGREGLGTGDVKLLAALGAFLGLPALPAVLLLAAVQGLVFAGGYLVAQRGKALSERGLQSVRHLAVPFGPFLVLAGLQWLLLGRWAEAALHGWLGCG
jgi:leader peptidase (prepilin peptidase)/N-methyltransferase